MTNMGTGDVLEPQNEYEDFYCPICDNIIQDSNKEQGEPCFECLDKVTCRECLEVVNEDLTEHGGLCKECLPRINS